SAALGLPARCAPHAPAVSDQVSRTVAIRDGRTSSETLRHDISDGSDRHAVEYAMLDRAGRVQLPRNMLDQLGMRDRVRLEAEPDHIGVGPGAGAAGGRPRRTT